MPEQPQEQHIYHTFFREFQGASAQEVVQSLYEDSRAGTGMDFQAWWNYQKKLWDTRYGLTIPEADTAGAEQKLLDVLLQVGALERGHKASMGASHV